MYMRWCCFVAASNATSNEKLKTTPAAKYASQKSNSKWHGGVGVQHFRNLAQAPSKLSL
jgi:hypothetical protein